MNIRFDCYGRPQNPSVQIDTSISALVREQVDVTTSNTEPQFMQESDDPIDIFRAQDPLYWYKYDPLAVSDERKSDAVNATSSESARNINPAYSD